MHCVHLSVYTLEMTLRMRASYTLVVITCIHSTRREGNYLLEIAHSDCERNSKYFYSYLTFYIILQSIINY